MMKLCIPLLSATLALGALALTPALAADDKTPTKADFDRLTQLQIFLDDANFGPGKIDGRWGEFTRKSLARYLRANDQTIPEFTDEIPATFPVDASSIDPIYTEYTVQQSDLDSLGTVPSEPEEQAEQDSMPYANLTELIAEKYHVDREYLATLNEGTTIDDAKPGDKITVPAVKEPFSLADIQKRAEDQKAEDDAKKETDEDTNETAEASPTPTPDDAKVQSIFISTSDKMLDLYEGKRLTASFPITPGSDSLPAPTGDWEVTSITFLPWFRHDEKMLNEGERSTDAHNIPPGPNNAVGIVWMAINKKGIGIHGTAAPDTIGRSNSHGCIRLANWDAAQLAEMIEPDTRVHIE